MKILEEARRLHVKFLKKKAKKESMINVGILHSMFDSDGSIYAEYTKYETTNNETKKYGS